LTTFIETTPIPVVAEEITAAFKKSALDDPEQLYQAIWTHDASMAKDVTARHF